MSKMFGREELISSSDLKDISKKKLFDEMLSVFHKLGLVHNNEIRAVILDIKTYEKMIDRIEELEELYENLELVDEYEDRIHISSSDWIKKPAHLSRFEFLQQQATKGNSNS